MKVIRSIHVAKRKRQKDAEIEEIEQKIKETARELKELLERIKKEREKKQ